MYTYVYIDVHKHTYILYNTYTNIHCIYICRYHISICINSYHIYIHNIFVHMYRYACKCLHVYQIPVNDLQRNFKWTVGNKTWLVFSESTSHALCWEKSKKLWEWKRQSFHPIQPPLFICVAGYILEINEKSTFLYIFLFILPSERGNCTLPHNWRCNIPSVSWC